MKTSTTNPQLGGKAEKNTQVTGETAGNQKPKQTYKAAAGNKDTAEGFSTQMDLAKHFIKLA